MDICIHYRGDIKLTKNKGKFYAQVSHALGAFWLGLMHHEDDSLFLRGDEYDAWKEWREDGCPISIIELPSKEAINELENASKYSAKIIDEGRTVFPEPTITCIASCNRDLSRVRKHKAIESEKEGRQYLIVNRDSKLDKLEMAKRVVVASLDAWVRDLCDTGSEIRIPVRSEQVKSWIFGPFVKIALKADNNYFLERITIFPVTYSGIDCLATSPQYADELKKVGGNLKLLR